MRILKVSCIAVVISFFLLFTALVKAEIFALNPKISATCDLGEKTLKISLFPQLNGDGKATCNAWGNDAGSKDNQIKIRFAVQVDGGNPSLKVGKISGEGMLYNDFQALNQPFEILVCGLGKTNTECYNTKCAEEVCYSATVFESSLNILKENIECTKKHDIKVTISDNPGRSEICRGSDDQDAISPDPFPDSNGLIFSTLPTCKYKSDSRSLGFREAGDQVKFSENFEAYCSNQKLSLRLGSRVGACTGEKYGECVVGYDGTCTINFNAPNTIGTSVFTICAENENKFIDYRVSLDVRARTGPKILKIEPTGKLTTDSTKLKATTDVAAKCMYSISDVDYDEMWDELTPMSEGKEHEKDLSGLSEGTHTYYVNCKNSDGIKMFNPFEITFTVASKGVISGIIKDGKTGETLRDVQVTIGPVPSFSDANGKYTATNVPPGKYAIAVSKGGYAPVSISNFEVTPGLVKNDLDFKLSQTYELKISSTSCDKSNNKCTLAIEKNTYTENLIAYFWLFDDSSGKLFYKGQAVAIGSNDMSKISTISKISDCPSGTNLKVLYNIFGQSESSNRISRLKSDAFVC